jgi:hypothetical protein
MESMKQLLAIGCVWCWALVATGVEYPALDSPQNAVRVYYLSLANGDKVKFKSCIHASAEHVEAVSGMADMSKAIIDYQKELTKIDAEAAKSASPGRLLGYAAFLTEADDMDIDFDGEVAISVSKTGPPVQFRKVGETWKLDLSTVEAMGASQLQAETIQLALPKLRRHLDLVLTMIREERVTAKEANGSLGPKINQIMFESTREAQLALSKKKK